MATRASGAALCAPSAARLGVQRPRVAAVAGAQGIRPLCRTQQSSLQIGSPKGWKAVASPSSSPRVRTARRGALRVEAKKKEEFRPPRFGEQPWQYGLSMLENALEAQSLVRFVREQPLLSVGIGVALASAISFTIASLVLPTIFFAIGAVTLFPLFAFIFSAAAFSFGIFAFVIFGGVGGTLLLTYGAKIAVFTKLVVPAVTAIAAGAVTVAVATRIGNAMAQRPQADDDGAIDAEASSSSSPASALGGRGRGAAQQDQRAGSAPVVEQEIDLAAEEFRLFDERLLGSDPSQWSSGEVAVWLQKAGFGAYADAFRAQDVDGRVLLSLAFDDLREEALGISSLGERKRLNLAIEALKGEQERKRRAGRNGAGGR